MSLFIRNSFSHALLIAVILGASHVSVRCQPAPIPLKDFFRNPEKIDYRLSPDGNYTSYLAPSQGRLNIFVQKIGDKDARCVTSSTKRDIRRYFWKSDTWIMYFMDNNGDENYHLFGVTQDGSMVRDFTPLDGVQVRLVDSLDEDDERLLISTNARDKKVFDVYCLTLQTGALELVAQNPGNITRWVTDHGGKVRVAIALDGTQRTVLYRETEQDQFQSISTTDFRDFIHPLLFTFDNKQLYALSNVGRDKQALVIFDPATQRETELIYEHPEYDLSTVHVTSKRKLITAVDYIAWKHERIFFDSQTEELYKRVENLCPGHEVLGVSCDKNEDKFIFVATSDRSQGTDYLYDRTADTLTKLSDRTPWLHEEQLAAVKPIKYLSRDGLTIHGYLTVPQGCEPKNLPVVVVPHGGPWMRDAWSYNPEVQFLANRGYAVLQMNFRGSTSYGKRFWQLSFKQWGRTMQDDITDGAFWLIKEGIADPRRIAIYGGSYGGYAALSGITSTPDLYACCIDYVGISNLLSWFQSWPEYWKLIAGVTYEQVGHPEADKEMLKQVSPLFHVDKIKAPLFVAQGRMDPRVPISESDQLVAELKKRGVEVEYMVKDNEGHGFGNEENKFDFYGAMEKFLERHLKS